MNRKNLLKKELSSFVYNIKKEYHPEKIILFGSMTSDKVNAQSDLDLVLIKKTTDDFWTRLQKISKFCSHKVGMDVLVYTPEEYKNLTSTRLFFKKEIAEKGQILYDTTQTS